VGGQETERSMIQLELALDDWRKMKSAPWNTYPIQHIQIMTSTGEIYIDCHFACGGGEDQPRFSGWFVPFTHGRGFYEVNPILWRP